MNGLEIGKISGFLTHSRPPEQQILDQEQGPDPGLLSTRHFRHLETQKKGKFFVVFFRMTSFRRVWFRPENETFSQILGVPTGGKNPEE